MGHTTVTHGTKDVHFLLRTLVVFCSLFMLPHACVRDGGTTVHPADNDGADIPLEAVDIDKRYLTEGFIGTRIHRVVIVTPRGSAHSVDAITRKGALRSRVSMERSLGAENIPVTRNTRAAILRLIEDRGTLRKTDIEHGRYDIYYYDVTRENIRKYLKNASLEP
ncbi:MAG: hypothetical protein JW838_09160 [Spirochaetes bacterium]|nr:hypothetical protein [Spirochaetota bacterium]